MPSYVNVVKLDYRTIFKAYTFQPTEDVTIGGKLLSALECLTRGWILTPIYDLSHPFSKYPALVQYYFKRILENQSHFSKARLIALLQLSYNLKVHLTTPYVVGSPLMQIVQPGLRKFRKSGLSEVNL